MLAFVNTYTHTYVSIKAHHACTEAEQAYVTKILLSGTFPVHKHQARCKLSENCSEKGTVHGCCIEVQWPLNVTWTLGLSTG